MIAMRLIALLGAAVLLTGAKPAPRDPVNPTCPKSLDWSANRQMQFTVKQVGTAKVLLAEGPIDAGVPDRMMAAIEANKPVDEIWFRSPGGDAAAGNAAGRMIRKAGIPTRIPAGWACFSACNFMFMGGPIRVVEPGGLFIVHMLKSVISETFVTYVPGSMSYVLSKNTKSRSTRMNAGSLG